MILASWSSCQQTLQPPSDFDCGPQILLFQRLGFLDGIAVDPDGLAVPVLNMDERGVVEAKDRFFPLRPAVISPPISPADFIGEVLEKDIHRRFVGGETEPEQRPVGKSQGEIGEDLILHVVGVNGQRQLVCFHLVFLKANWPKVRESRNGAVSPDFARGF